MVVGFIIRALKEDTLSTGMFDVFFKRINHSCLCSIDSNLINDSHTSMPLGGLNDLHLPHIFSI
jgi:hypothetical protein